MKELYLYLKEHHGLDLQKKDLEKIIKLARVKKRKFDFREALINYGFNEELVDEWMLIRKTKKGINSEFAFNNFIKQVELKGINKNDLLKILCQKQWVGYNHKWDISDSIETYEKKEQGNISEDFKRAVLRDLQTGGGI